jgi:iron(III) transport system ATP-binding protein
LLSVTGLVKTFGARAGEGPVRALRGVSFDVAQGEFFSLLGPSGCGKTTILQCVAGLEHPDAGDIVMAGQPVFSAARNVAVPANRRELGVVFQTYAIWPHMTVFDNVAFPLAHGPRRYSKAEIAERVRKALDRVKLASFADRLAPHLSGGQQQRVALARALVHEPRLILLDEPLSNLDARLRDAMRVELRQLVKSVGITALFVTHDQTEAMGMSDRLALMRDGVIVQQGAPRDVYLHPRSVFAAGFMGGSNTVPGEAQTNAACTDITTSFGTVRANRAADLPAGPAALVIRPHAVRLHADGQVRLNQFDARIEHVSFLGDLLEIEVDLAGQRLRVLTDSAGAYAPGPAVQVELPPEQCIVVPREAEGG